MFYANEEGTACNTIEDFVCLSKVDLVTNVVRL